MKTTKTPNRMWKWLRMVMILALCARAHAGGLNPGGPKDAPVVPVPKSVFVDDPDKGKDPFFPHSVRRTYVAPRPVAQSTAAAEPSALFKLLQLKGISGVKGEPLAIINGSTISEREVADIRCGGRIVRVRCLEIRSSSVIIELDGTGESCELKLRDNI